jgi:hypothetical protein
MFFETTDFARDVGSFTGTMVDAVGGGVFHSSGILAHHYRVSK